MQKDKEVEYLESFKNELIEKANKITIVDRVNNWRDSERIVSNIDELMGYANVRPDNLYIFIESIRNSKSRNEAIRNYFNALDLVGDESFPEHRAHKYCFEYYKFKPLTSFKSDNYPHIILDSKEIDIILFRTRELLNILANGKLLIERWETSIEKAVIDSITLGLTKLERKFVEMPSEINYLYDMIYMLITWAKISESNKRILLSGVRNYINMQKEEINDLTTDDRWPQMYSQTLKYIANSMLLDFEKQLKRLLRKGGKVELQGITDIYPQAPGKDYTNEFNFAKNPFSTPDESEENTLDKIRNRQNKNMPGCNGYDYEFSKVGFEIDLEKATKLDFTKEYAHQSATAQVVKGYVLMICSMFFCKHYKSITWGWDDEIDVQSNIPLDMKEREINPYIKRFNAEVGFKHVKNAQLRYNEGLSPQITPMVKLALINESSERYVNDFTNLYTQLSKEAKLKINEIRTIKGKLYEYITRYTYKEFSINTECYAKDYKCKLKNGELQCLNTCKKSIENEAKEIIKENEKLKVYEIESIIMDFIEKHKTTELYDGRYTRIEINKKVAYSDSIYFEYLGKKGYGDGVHFYDYTFTYYPIYETQALDYEIIESK